MTGPGPAPGSGPDSRQPEYDERSPAQSGPASREQQLPTQRQLRPGQCQYRNQIKPGAHPSGQYHIHIHNFYVKL